MEITIVEKNEIPKKEVKNKYYEIYSALKTLNGKVLKVDLGDKKPQIVYNAIRYHLIRDGINKKYTSVTRKNALYIFEK